MRWVFCATDRCFFNPVLASFVEAGKAMPLERGAGIKQPGMDDAVHKLARGDWVQLFPEGTRTYDGSVGRCRAGVGRLVAEAEPTPVILPFVHVGMERVLGRGQSNPFSFGKRVDVLIGEPIEVDDILADCKSGVLEERSCYIAIAERVGGVLRGMHAQLVEATDYQWSPPPRKKKQSKEGKVAVVKEQGKAEMKKGKEVVVEEDR
eukprot:PLAT14688.2.p2 GENE.PLAT14688.2~~PLAT14688.2.p2  ORF type:complete len:206 (+),score=74.43 PLAT14688.2:392-1009(+)